jgi:hypothetical protein
MIQCYGFLAVFVTPLTDRRAQRDHDFHREMQDMTEQIERLAMMLLLGCRVMRLGPTAAASSRLTTQRWKGF